MSRSDQELILAISEGEEKSLHELYHRYSSMVYNLALVHVQQTVVAEELTQDVFLEVFKSATKFRGQAGVKTWLYRITVNKSLDQLRKEQTKKRSIWKKLVAVDEGRGSPLESIPAFDHPGIQLENKELARQLFQGIYQLKDRQKSAFILSFVEGLPRKQVAEVMNITEKALEGLLQRAKAKLRIILEDLNPKRGKKE